MKCPHCLVEFHEQWIPLDPCLHDVRGDWHLYHSTCPKCRRIIIRLDCPASEALNVEDGLLSAKVPGRRTQLVHPRAYARSPLPPEVPAQFAGDYAEACLVLPDSEKASAALSRRCLQNLLYKKESVKKGDLVNQIQQVIESGKLPAHLADAIDAVRAVGNFAAHPIKNTRTGEIIDVEPGEAEWLLDTLEELFDFYFVGPEKLKLKRKALNKKLFEAGKPPLKGATP